MAKSITKWLQVATVIASLTLASTSSWANNDYQEEHRPGWVAMTADALVVRPITLIGTLVGSVIWVATSPITAMTGTIGEAGETLVIEPGASTFYRCLGCTEIGFRKLPKEKPMSYPNRYDD